MKQHWSNLGARPVSGASRNGASWNSHEEHDLRQAWQNGYSIRQIAAIHERLENAIEIRLCRLYGVPYVEQLPKVQQRMAGEDTWFINFPKKLEGYWVGVQAQGPGSKTTWTTHSGKEIRVRDMDLDHMLNSINDMNFRVAQMRHVSTKILGTNNRNVGSKTVDAFTVVHPKDVFPIYPAMLERARNGFYERFGHHMATVRKAVYSAWGVGTSIDADLGDAVRFYLNSTGMPRLDAYLKTFDVGTDAQFAQMCWNLRADQTTCWTKINALGLTSKLKTIPPNRLNSAVKAIQPRHAPDDLVLDEWFDHQF